MIRRGFLLTGQVQGVGCRPFLFRLAKRLGLTGFVRNEPAGVWLEVQGDLAAIQTFENILRRQSDPDWPPVMHISEMQQHFLPTTAAEIDFAILPSRSDFSDKTAVVLPDMAVCEACLKELYDAADFRYQYPFITCTHCGPRYSIIQSIPYDRTHTTMSAFTLCARCKEQYENPADRRFHAQPVACPVCGPRLWLVDHSGSAISTESRHAIATAAEVLAKGLIVAIKGIGGFHLAVNALNESAVARLRLRKRRSAKPFAMMVRDVSAVEQYALVDEIAKKWLESPQRPIVLLPKKDSNAIAPSVAANVGTYGFMLCYAPVHYLLFDQPQIDVLVMTSANFAEEPLICDNRQALAELSSVADYFLMHDRDIWRQTDDSVLQIIDQQPAMLRRSRGFVPLPIYSKSVSKKVIFAAGADLKNTFCFVKNNQFLLSEHIGDLSEGRSYKHYVRSVEHFSALFELKPQVVVCDLHPTYLSTQFAQSLGIEPLLAVQHHWAHAASVLAETGYDKPVIALVADGTGYGQDGAVWGCECLIASLTDYQRVGHLAYFPLAGGDRAAREAFRPLAGLIAPQGDVGRISHWQDVLRTVESDFAKWQMVCMQLEKRINTVMSSSLGRLFDAAAALAGCGAQNTFEAQLPMALEAIADVEQKQIYPIDYVQNMEGQWLWRYEPLIEAMLMDARAKTPPAVMSARFHNTVCTALTGFAVRARENSGINVVALSGGVFCNRRIASQTTKLLQREGFEVLWKRQVPVNDGGIALGQAAIAIEMCSR